jgi:23S rRNA pseudouridine2605 synthase
MERLQKIISAAGITSRRAAEELILAGRVSVNGQIVKELGSKADPHKDTITLDGTPVKPAEKLYYLLLHKPAGYVTSLKDPQGRQLVTELIKDVDARLFPVGRLDYNSEGLLLLTNDGAWANHLMHPRHQVDKEYHVRVRGKVDPQQLKKLSEEMELEDGPAAGATVRIIRNDQQNDWLSITIREGRNRQVRRMCAAVGLSVVRLRRIRYGNLTLGGLKPGQYRLLTAQEAKALVATKKLATSRTTAVKERK